MTRVSFDSTKKPLEDLLKQARSGVIQLPDFQRSWVWKDEGLRELLASVSQSFPVGTLMTLQTGGEVEFKPRMIEGAEPTAIPPDALLLDGQQRLTSLFQTTMRQEVVKTFNAKKQPIERFYYIDMVKALDPDADRREAIVGIGPDRRETSDFGRVVDRDLSEPSLEYAARMFPTNRLFAPDEWMMGFFKHWNFAPDKTEFWLRFQNEVIAAFRQYQMPVIELDKSTSREAVCLVFEKVNTGGEKLDAFELLTAIYAASAFDLREDWRGGSEAGDGRARRMAQGIAFPKNVLTQLQATDFLQAVSLLHSLERRRAFTGAGDPPPVTAKRDDLLKVPFDRYVELAPRIEAGFVATGRLLFGERVYAARDLPYQSQLIPLAVVMADLGEAALTQDARAKLVRWWWSGVFGELYGSAIESRFSRDVQEVGAWVRGGDEPTTVRDANFRAERLDTMTSRLSAAYKGVHVLLMQTGASDFRTGQPFDQLTYFGESVDIHHIFPKAWCEANGIAKSRYDSIVNKTPLFYKTNRIIGGHAPSTYLGRLLKDGSVESAARQDDILGSHGVSPEAMRSDDFDSHYQTRREALIELIQRAMGKAVFRQDVEAADEPAPIDDGEEQEDEILEQLAG